jgi:hypothetical protein
MGTCAEAENLAEKKKDRMAVLSMGNRLANDPVECQSGSDPGLEAGGGACPNQPGPLKTKIRGSVLPGLTHEMGLPPLAVSRERTIDRAALNKD